MKSEQYAADIAEFIQGEADRPDPIFTGDGNENSGGGR
jgi:hypothetical protein